MIETNKLKFYIIQHPNGRFLHHFSSYHGGTWVDEITEAKIFLKISSCRSTVTSLFKFYPDQGVSSIIEITGGSFNVLNETDRVTKSIKKTQTEKINREKYHLEEKKKKIEIEVKKLQEELVTVNKSLSDITDDKENI